MWKAVPFASTHHPGKNATTPRHPLNGAEKNKTLINLFAMCLR